MAGLVWEWIQTQLLGMQWLSDLVGTGLERMGLDLTSRLGGSIQFFLYDVGKISLLLVTLIFAVSYVQSYFPPQRSRRILGRFRGLQANVFGALLGTVTPFCSCSSIPLFMGFTGAGIPLGVTFSFLISSPMVDLGSLVLLMSIFGARVAVIYVAAGLVIAVCGGTLIQKLRLDDQVEPFVRAGSGADGEQTQVPTQKERLQEAAQQAASTFRKVLPYILIGVGVGAVIHNWIPQDWILGLLGNGNPLGVLVAVAVGIPMYADIFGTIPVAEALLARGADLGTVLAFMMAVTTLSLPSLILLRKAIKPKLLVIFIGVCALGILLVGYGFNAGQAWIGPL